MSVRQSVRNAIGEMRYSYLLLKLKEKVNKHMILFSSLLLLKKDCKFLLWRFRFSKSIEFKTYFVCQSMGHATSILMSLFSSFLWLLNICLIHFLSFCHSFSASLFMDVVFLVYYITNILILAKIRKITIYVQSKKWWKWHLTQKWLNFY